MPRKGDCPGRARPRAVRLLQMPLLVGLLGTACEERDRLTFPTPSDGIGPVTTIDRPNVGDTTVTAGPDFVLQGRTIDPDGVDTVYFLVSGNQHFNPFRPSPPADTVRFGLPLTTNGLNGDTIRVEIHGVDSEGNRGAASFRQIFVQ
jgi:hypothetical protein